MKRCAIIGGGISGLTAAYRLQQALQVDLYEAGADIGGVIRSEIVENCVLDGGPDSFLTQKRSAIQLCRELGLENSLVSSNDAHRKTFLLKNGTLKPFPDGFFLMVPTRILPLVTTDLLSWPGKFAALSDLFASPETRDCAVGGFIEKRFGREILTQIAEPLLSGVYGANIQNLSLKSALPQLWEIQKKGSLIRQLARAGLRPSPASANAESLFTTLKGGMQTLVNALREKSAAVQWRLDTNVRRISKVEGKWNVGSGLYDVLLIATSKLPDIETSAGNQIRQLMGEIRLNSAIVVSLCFGNITREGFGWLVPLPERRSILAATYVNNKFPGRCTEDKFLVRTFIGGSFAQQWIDKSDDDIYREVLQELRRIAGIDAKPLFSRIYRWKDAMPEYAVGHEELITQIETIAAQEKNLFLTGNVFSGVGIPDCIRHAEKVASTIAAIEK